MKKKSNGMNETKNAGIGDNANARPWNSKVRTQRTPVYFDSLLNAS